MQGILTTLVLTLHMEWQSSLYCTSHYTSPIKCYFEWAYASAAPHCFRSLQLRELLYLVLSIIMMITVTQMISLTGLLILNSMSHFCHQLRGRERGMKVRNTLLYVRTKRHFLHVETVIYFCYNFTMIHRYILLAIISFLK